VQQTHALLEEITTQIVRIGKHFQQHGGSRVAIYLPNSVEFLTALFACNFYDLTPILLPYDQPAETLISMLQRSKADTMIGAVGTLPFEAVTREYAGLRQLIWVLDKGNKHMHWDEVPKGTGGEVNVLTWQEITGEKQGGMELPPLDAKSVPKGVVSFWQSRKTDEGQLVEYSQANLVSAISAQLSAIPVRERINSDDLFLPVDSLSTVYTLVLTLAALYYNSSVALNSVAGRDADISAATAGISPTIIVAPASTVSKLHEESSSKLTSPLHRLVHWFQTGTLTQNGVMPSHSLLTAINNGARPKLGATPGKLRMLFTSEQLNGDSPPLTPAQLSDLRIFTGARVIYALTGPKVAGAVTQTAFYDYRIENPQKQSHFGAPLSSVEMLLRDVKGFKTTDESAMGEIVVRGPAVVGGGEARMGAVGVLRGDGCLAYV
jgi:acyl-CoA synthetase (AMP-forming)/AMP-acid ligase II